MRWCAAFFCLLTCVGIIVVLVGYGGGIVADVAEERQCNATEAAQTNCYQTQGKDVDQTDPLASSTCTCEVDKVRVSEKDSEEEVVRKWVSESMKRGPAGSPPNCSSIFPPGVRTCYAYPHFDTADDENVYSYVNKRHKSSRGMLIGGSMFNKIK